MQYEPIKGVLGRFFRKSVFLRKLLYKLLDILLLRSWHVRKVINRAAETLPENTSMLDAGSGFGQYSWRICRQHKGWKVCGIDINPDDTEQCNEFFQKTGLKNRVEFKTGDLTALSDSERYDLILSVDVMEHIREDEKVFRNFFNALRDNGLLIISTPSDKGGSDVHHSGGNSFIDEHVRNGYGKDEISNKLKLAGFSETSVSYTYGPAGSLSWKISMKIPVLMLNRSYAFFILLPVYYLFVFPLSFILNIIDVNSTLKSGTGLLISAKK